MYTKTLSAAVFAIILIIGTLLAASVSKSQVDIKVGLYYYVWYDDGYGNRHWNGTPPDDNFLLWNVVDKPLLDYYSSQNTTVIKQHLDWFEELGIDFLIVSWWGPNSYEDNSTKGLFSLLTQGNYPIEIAIMVEAYDPGNNYSFTEIYDYIYSSYASPYQDFYIELDGKPLVCFYNDSNMTGTEAQRTDIHFLDTRFTARIVGHNDYVDWWFGIPCSVNNSRTPPLSKKDSMICVEPRYDNYYINVTPLARFDANYTEELYNEQWSEALGLAKDGRINLVTIYSWNEYHERSQIEPHTADGKPVLSAFSKTKSYIDQIKSTEQQTSNPFAYILIGIVIGAVITWLFLRYRGRDYYIREKVSQQTSKEEETQEESLQKEPPPDDEET